MPAQFPVRKIISVNFAQGFPRSSFEFHISFLNSHLEKLPSNFSFKIVFNFELTKNFTLGRGIKERAKLKGNHGKPQK